MVRILLVLGTALATETVFETLLLSVSAYLMHNAFLLVRLFLSSRRIGKSQKVFCLGDLLQLGRTCLRKTVFGHPKGAKARL